MMPQLGWNTQVHSTALIAPGSTQGRRMIERSDGDAEEVAIEEQRAGGADDHDQRRGEQREERASCGVPRRNIRR